MCGDDDVVRNGRLVSHHRLAAFVAQRRKNTAQPRDAFLPIYPKGYNLNEIKIFYTLYGAV